MNMSKKIKMLCCGAFMFIFCFLAVGYASVQDTLTVNGTVSVQAQTKDYKVIYHTYKDGADYSETQTFDAPSSTITIRDSISNGQTGIFKGWVSAGVYSENVSATQNPVYYEGTTTTFSTLRDEQKLSEDVYEVHLYDIYDSYPTITVTQHPKDELVSVTNFGAQTPFRFKSKVVNSNGTVEYDFTDPRFAINITRRKNPQVYKFHCHPGISVNVVGDTPSSSGKIAYINSTNTSKSTNITETGYITPTSNQTYYAGVDYTPSNTKIVYYHSYNANGDYILDYDEYFNDTTDSTGGNVTIRPASNVNSYGYINNWNGLTGTFRSWALSAVVAKDGSTDRINEYQAGTSGLSFRDLYNAQTTDTEANNINTVKINGVSVECVRLFDIYTSNATITALPHPQNKVSVMYNIGLSCSYGTLPSCRPASGNLWTLAAGNTTGISFYYHPGVILHSQTGSGNRYWLESTGQTEYMEDVWQTLNGTSPLQASGYAWAVADGSPNGSGEQAGKIDTGTNPPTLTVANDAGRKVALTYAGPIIIYDASNKPSNALSSEPSTCFVSGTLITLADGSRVPVEQLTGNEMLLAFDHETGQYVATPMLYYADHGDQIWNVINLNFSDGTYLGIIQERALFDITLNRYVWINCNNYQQYIGHEFFKATDNNTGYERVVLESATAEEIFTGCYTVMSEYHFNHFGNGMLSLPGGMEPLFNFFEYDSELKYDEVKKQEDIAKYGLIEYEDFKDLMSEDVFNNIYPVKYLSVGLGKGIITQDDISMFITDWVYGKGFADKFQNK